MDVALLRLSALLFASGVCALIYQTAWLRELRLIFGASTPASAAVLAIFMGGLGLGGALLGRRAEAHPRPLAFYGRLELLITISTAVTPALIWLVRAVYIGLGGSTALGSLGGTLVRLILSALVLAVPTVLMGGTLPALARAAETQADVRRRNLGLLYGVNTLGAVTGTLLSTFYLLERVGNRGTLWLACALNLAVAVAALRLAGQQPELPQQEAEPEHSGADAERPPLPFVLAGAALLGFTFLLMELCFYRMVAPLLGGSTYTFGLILAIALLGIGLGGLVYSRSSQERPATVAGLALTCGLQALGLAIPLALGDRIAVFTIAVRPLGEYGFFASAIGWTMVTGLIVLPAALVAGYQFPLLIALLGKGRAAVGRQVGLAYAWNTAGSIVGSLAGGFGLLPLLSAPGVWRLCILLLSGLSAVALLLAKRRQHPLLHYAPVLAAVAAALMCTAQGPTAAWRHSSISIGLGLPGGGADYQLHRWMNDKRRHVLWEADGIESSVAVRVEEGVSFVVGGKIDGSARGDSATQVMGGLLGSILHSNPRRALVVGLGTGSTAGWLGSVPEIERVDVAEIEPNILRVARNAAAVNQNVMDNPKVHVQIGDARELMLTRKETYDLIMSEPSNPYRAGIASLYTAEFYRSAAQRLAQGGIFLQWIQLYSIDSQTLRTIYATIASEFPYVESWVADPRDLMLVASREPIPHDVASLTARIQRAPHREALLHSWRTVTLEGFLAHFIAQPAFARDIALAHPPLNTDDRTIIEFGLARSLGKSDAFDAQDLYVLAKARGVHRPELSGTVDWSEVEMQRIAMLPASDTVPRPRSSYSEVQGRLALALANFYTANAPVGLQWWRTLAREPKDVTELSLLAAGLASTGDEGAVPYLRQLRTVLPIEADILIALLHFRKGRTVEAATALEPALLALREDPWTATFIIRIGLLLSRELGAQNHALAPRLQEAVSKPFALYAAEQHRLSASTALIQTLGFGPACIDLLNEIEPNVWWQQDLLTWRLNCYRSVNDQRAELAQHDLDALHAEEPPSLGRGLGLPQ